MDKRLIHFRVPPKPYVVYAYEHNHSIWFFEWMNELINEWMNTWTATSEKNTYGHMRPSRIQISLRIRAVWSESSLGLFWLAKNQCFFMQITKILFCSGRENFQTISTLSAYLTFRVEFDRQRRQLHMDDRWKQGCKTYLSSTMAATSMCFKSPIVLKLRTTTINIVVNFTNGTYA